MWFYTLLGDKIFSISVIFLFYTAVFSIQLVTASLTWNTQRHTFQTLKALAEVPLVSLLCSFGEQDSAGFNMKVKSGTHLLFSASY